jgi:hypothetical protein
MQSRAATRLLLEAALVEPGMRIPDLASGSGDWPRTARAISVARSASSRWPATRAMRMPKNFESQSRNSQTPVAAGGLGRAPAGAEPVRGCSITAAGDEMTEAPAKSAMTYFGHGTYSKSSLTLGTTESVSKEKY